MYVRNGLISLSKRERNSLRSACLGSLGWIKLQLSLLRDPELLPVLAEHFWFLHLQMRVGRSSSSFTHVYTHVSVERLMEKEKKRRRVRSGESGR